MADVQMWRYSVPPTKFGEWGIFLLDSTGFFAVVSDYGNFAHLWTHHGCADFREFLLDLEPDYLCSKLGTKNVLDEKMSLQLIRETLEQSEEPLEVEWELLEDLQSRGLENGFQEWSENTLLQPSYEYLCYTYSLDLRHFAEKVYPRFVELLRKDLA